MVKYIPTLGNLAESKTKDKSITNPSVWWTNHYTPPLRFSTTTIMTTFSVNKSSNDRIGISFSQDNAQTTIFVTNAEFVLLMGKMLDYKDAHIEELKKAVQF